MVIRMQCSICKISKEVNLILFGRNICTDCEGKLIRSKVEDASYHQYMDGIKDILATAEKE